MWAYPVGQSACGGFVLFYCRPFGAVFSGLVFIEMVSGFCAIYRHSGAYLQMVLQVVFADRMFSSVYEKRVVFYVWPYGRVSCGKNCMICLSMERIFRFEDGIYFLDFGTLEFLFFMAMMAKNVGRTEEWRVLWGLAFYFAYKKNIFNLDLLNCG